MSPETPPTPLSSIDPDRDAVLRRKILERLQDVRRHLLALRAAMAEFGDDFDRTRFASAFTSEDPLELNRVKAVERGVDQLYNYIAELAALGLELGMVRPRHADLNARRDLDSLIEIAVITPTLGARLQRLRELRRLLVHEYASATAEQVHEAALTVDATFIPFYDAYRQWIANGFAAAR